MQVSSIKNLNFFLQKLMTDCLEVFRYQIIKDISKKGFFLRIVRQLIAFFVKIMLWS